MLVYGDRVRTEDPRAKLERLAQDLRALAGQPPGIERHGRLVALFIEASEFCQGVSDAEFVVRGCDAESPAQARAMALLLGLARAVRQSWRSGFEPPPVLPDLRRVLAADRWPDSIEVKTAEGYAFYALYPEAYAAAAAALGRDPPQVIGIRSIGAGLGAWWPPRPARRRPSRCGRSVIPFRRALALAPDLSARLLADRGTQYAVVDEGPGLSGARSGPWRFSGRARRRRRSHRLPAESPRRSRASGRSSPSRALGAGAPPCDGFRRADPSRHKSGAPP
jgi:hypothetical protein